MYCGLQVYMVYMYLWSRGYQKGFQEVIRLWTRDGRKASLGDIIRTKSSRKRAQRIYVACTVYASIIESIKTKHYEWDVGCGLCRFDFQVITEIFWLSWFVKITAVHAYCIILHVLECHSEWSLKPEKILVTSLIRKKLGWVIKKNIKCIDIIKTK